MALSHQFVGAAGTAMKDLLLAHVCSAVAGVDINIFGVDLHPFGFLQDWSDNLTADANAALAAATTTVQGITGTSNANQVAPVVNGIQGNIAANASAIAALQTTATPTGGATYSDTFNTPSSGSIGPDFSLTSNSSVAMWEVVSGQGAGVTAPAGSSASTQIALLTATTMQTDGHQATVVVGSAPNTIATSGLVVRATSNLSTFVFAVLRQDHAYIGYASWNGSAFSSTSWVDTPITLAQGNRVTLTASGQTYTLSINGNSVLAHTDAAVQSPVGSSNRSAGFMCNIGTDLFGDHPGWFVNSFSAADVQPPTVIGTGWSLVRSAATGLTVPSGGGWEGVGSGTFDTEVTCSTNISSSLTPTNLGYGIVTIPIEGWYSITFGAGFGSAAGSGTIAAGIYLRTAASPGTLTLQRRGQDSTGSSAWNVCMTDVLYLHVGDQVSPAIKAVTPNTLIGDAAGSNTYFDGALLRMP